MLGGLHQKPLSREGLAERLWQVSLTRGVPGTLLLSAQAAGQQDESSALLQSQRISSNDAVRTGYLQRHSAGFGSP